MTLYWLWMVILMRNKHDDFEDVEPMEFYDLVCELNKIKHDFLNNGI